MRTLSTQTERAAMVPSPVRALLDTLKVARVAGGAVRDSLLHVQPKDWDVATSLRPEAVMQLASSMGWDVVPTGLQHGTVTVVVDGMPIEVTTLRLDVETNGRHAEVEFTTDWQVDAARRDLTMNSMFMDADGTVLDFFDGQKDLLAGKVRFVGNATERLQEDYLRVLRYFRFQGRVGSSKFDSTSMRAIRRNANGLRRISGERIWMEMSKILTGNLVGQMLEVMESSTVLSAVGIRYPSVQAAFGANCMNGRPETVLAALVNNAENASEVADAWRLSRRERETLAFVSRFLRDSCKMNSWDLLSWQKMVVEHGKDLTLEVMCLTNKAGLRDEIRAWEPVVFPVTGSDLLEAGYEAGPEMGRLLRALKQRWVDSDFRLSKNMLVTMVATL